MSEKTPGAPRNPSSGPSRTPSSGPSRNPSSGSVSAPSIILFAVLLLAALLSIAVPGTHFAKPESHVASVQALNEKKSGIEKLAGSAAAASAAITLMPGDFGTPIADKLADLSGYFLIILIAIYIEKFLVSIAGILAFDILVPVGLVLLAVGIFHSISFKKTALRIISLGLILVCLVPVTLKVSSLVEQQYDLEIRQTIDAANQNTEDLKGAADRSDDNSLWTEFIEKVKGGSSTILGKLESILNNFIDAIAIYIVTTCVIPVVVLILGIWLIKLLFHLDFTMPRVPRMSKYTTHRH